MATRRDRLAKIKKGPGVFVYGGGAQATRWVPTVKKTGKRDPVFDDEGLPVVDASGRQIYQSAGQIVRDIQGRPVLGGPPKVEKVPLDVIRPMGVELRQGVDVVVDDPAVALKLRMMAFVREVETKPGASGPGPSLPPRTKKPKKRAYHKKAKEPESV